jgi:YidC/Oxa1 family membrane protein insertase
MEQMRLLLAIVLSFLVFIIWQWLVVEPEMAKQAQQQAEITESQPAPAETAPPQDDAGAPAESAPAESPTPVLPVPTPTDRKARQIKVETPLYTVTFSEKGAALDDLILKKYREAVEPGSPLKDMVQPKAREMNLKAGWKGPGLEGMPDALYELATQEKTIVVEEDKRALEFQWINQDGVRVRKQFEFSADSYLINLKVIIDNASPSVLAGQPMVSIAHVVADPESRITFEGAMAFVNGELEEIKVKDLAEKPELKGTFRWVGVTDRYFMNVLIPEEAVNAILQMKAVDEDMVVSELVMPETTIASGERAEFNFKALIGPKEIEMLAEANYDLGEAVNFGMFDFLAKPFLWIMNQIYKVVPNYGIAIIVLTLLTKIVLWPLGNKSYKSMNDMKRMQPLMAEIREKHKNDKKKMNEETMALYRTYKINPMGGCLPMVVQLPVFLALYRMLYQAIELRHAPFFGWINDLSAPDRLFDFGFSIPFMQPPYGIPVLTVVMGATMFLQQKMSPPPGDPTQAKLMMFMPIIFTVIFINFPAGLVLYWLINNIFSIGQQYYIQKKYA